MYTQRLTPELTARLIRVSHGRRLYRSWSSDIGIGIGRAVSLSQMEGKGSPRLVSNVGQEPVRSRGRMRSPSRVPNGWLFQPEENRSFWDLARCVRAFITEAARLETIKEDTTGLRKFVDGMDVAGSGAVSERFNRELVVSNIGRVSFDTRFGWLRLTALWDRQFIQVLKMSSRWPCVRSGIAAVWWLPAGAERAAVAG